MEMTVTGTTTGTTNPLGGLAENSWVAGTWTVPYPATGCPNCGYCPHCGRGYNRHWDWPYYPWQNPITYTTTTSAAQEGQ